MSQEKPVVAAVYRGLTAGQLLHDIDVDWARTVNLGDTNVHNHNLEKAKLDQQHLKICIARAVQMSEVARTPKAQVVLVEEWKMLTDAKCSSKGRWGF